MSGNIKILFAVLALGAFASVYQFTTMLSPRSATTNTFASAVNALLAPSDNCSSDADGDGLPDCQETFWNTDWRNPDTDGDGFLDGEEVISGHNPAKKGPNDFLDSSKNITEKTKALLVGGITAGDLQPGTSTYENAAQTLADTIVADYEKNSAVIVDDLNLVGDSDQERSAYISSMIWMIKNSIVPALDDASKFLTSVQDVPAEDPAVLTDDPKRLNAYVLLSRSLANESGNRALKIAATPVPRTYSIQHKDLIRVMRILQRQYEIASTIKTDPIQGMTAIRALTTIVTMSLPNALANLSHVLR